MERGKGMRIINLTQHPATPEQITSGVIDMHPDVAAEVRAAMTFLAAPSAGEMVARADHIAQIAAMYDISGDDESPGVYPTAAMIGGAPYFMSALECALPDHGLKYLYAFSERVSVESVAPDGSVTKTNVFRHAGFVNS